MAPASTLANSGLNAVGVKGESTLTIRDFKDESPIDCPRCLQPNPPELIYCSDESCAAILHPGRIACGACHAAIPFNARFCPQCGRPTGYASNWKGIQARLP